MALHSQTHSAVGADHSISASSANMLVGINSSGTPLEYKVITGSANVAIVYATTQVTVASLPGYEELTLYAATSIQWTNMPAAITEFGLLRTQFNLTYFSSCRMAIQTVVAGTAGSHLFAQVSTDGGTTWIGLGAAGTTSPAVSMLTTGTVGTSPWVAIRAGYRTDVILRTVGSGGDGAIDPQISHIGIQFY